MNLKDMILAVHKAADSAFDLRDKDYLLVWDAEGYCRLYSCVTTNKQLLIPALQGYYTSYSIPIVI